MDADLAYGMAGPSCEQHGPRESWSIEDGVAGKDRLTIRRDEVTPGGWARIGGIRDCEPAARRAVIGEGVQPPVPPRVHAGLGIEALLHHAEVGRVWLRACQVGEPQVVARCCTAGGRHRQPATVAAYVHAVIVRLLHAGAEDQHVVLWRSPELMQVDAAMILVLARRNSVGRQPADVVEGLAAGQPGDGGISAPINRPLNGLAVR